MKIEDKLNSFNKSKFRSHFHLREKDFLYIKDKGFDQIKEHAYHFITERIALETIINDGKQTPMKGHPVFIAQHATATCCRGCLYKWHHIKQNQALSEEEIEYIVNIIMAWIKKEVKNNIDF